MNVFVSEQFEKEARTLGRPDRLLREITNALERVNTENLGAHSSIYKIGSTQDIYVLRHGDVRIFFTVRGSDAVLIGINKSELNVSKGQRLTFAADDKPVSGIIVRSESTPGFWASVTVETETPIPNHAKLTMPDLPETGGCGLAEPRIVNGRVHVELSIGYSYIDISTVGK